MTYEPTPAGYSTQEAQAILQSPLAQDKTICKHHWMLDELPQRGRFYGVCKLCGKRASWPAEGAYYYNSIASWETSDKCGARFETWRYREET